MTTAPSAGSIDTETQFRFRKMLPRIYELKDMADASHPDAYFQNLEEGLDTQKSKRAAYGNLERQLVFLDEEAWGDLKERAALVLQRREEGWGWRSLFDVFSEARGFGYLASIGCTKVRFIPRTKGKTPDLGAVRDGSPVLCEVKTINISKDEAGRRQRISGGAMVASATSLHVGEGFLNKLTTTLEHAVEQLDGFDPDRKAQRIVFTVVHFDDWVGDYQPQYFAEMDAHLSLNPVSGAELVFCAASNLFERAFTMTSATVLSD